MSSVCISPSITITESFENRGIVPVAENAFVAGFTSQGPTDLPYYLETINDYVNLFGEPDPAAPEQAYAFYSAKSVIDSGANLIFSRLPYGAEEGDTVGDEYTALVFPVVDCDTTTQGVSATIVGYESTAFYPASAFNDGEVLDACSGGSLDLANIDILVGTVLTVAEWGQISSCAEPATPIIQPVDNMVVFGAPVHMSLSKEQYDLIKCGEFDWSGSFTCDPSSLSAYDPETIGGAGMIIIDKSRSRTTNKFEGLYLTVTDNYNSDPATVFNDVTGIKYSIDNGRWDNVPDNLYHFALSADETTNVGAVSRTTVALGNTAVDAPWEDEQYKDHVNITLWRLIPNEGDHNNLIPVIVESHVGSLDVDRTFNEQGIAKSSYIQNIVEKDSNRLELLVNPNLSERTDWSNDSGDRTLAVRFMRTELSDEVKLNCGCYIDSIPTSVYVSGSSEPAVNGTYIYNSVNDRWEREGDPTIYIDNTASYPLYFEGSPEYVKASEFDTVLGDYTPDGSLTGTPEVTTVDNPFHADKMFSVSKFVQKTNTVARDVGNVPVKLQNALCGVDNPEQIDLNYTVDAGLSTIWTAVKADRDSWVTNDPRVNSFIFRDTVRLDVLGDLGRTATAQQGSGGLLRAYWQTIFDIFETFVSDTRPCNGGTASIHVADPLRHIFVQGRDCKVWTGDKDADSTFNELIYHPLKNLLAGVNSSYAVTYANWFKDVVVSGGSKLCWLPPSGKMVGVIANTPRVWTAAAGVNNGIIEGVKDLAINPRLRDRDGLYKLQANAIYADRDYGNIVFAQQTLSRPNTMARELYVRRTLLWFQQNAMRILKPYQFQANTLFVRTRIRSALEPHYNTALNGGALEDFQISFDGNTPNELQLGILKISFLLKFAGIIKCIRLDYHSLNSETPFSEVVLT